MTKHSLVLAVAASLVTCSCQRASEPIEDALRLDLTPAFGGLDLPADGVARFGDEYMLADSQGSRLISVNDRGELLESWSTLGESRTPLQEPVFLEQVNEDSAVVFQKGNRQVAKFDSEGRIQATTDLRDFFGLSLPASDHIWVGRPWSGALINIHSLRGEELAEFGALKTFEQSYPRATDVKSVHPRLRDPFLFLNLVQLEADGTGGAFATFRFSPFVQHYDKQGKLLWETRLEGGGIQNLEDNYLRDVKTAGNPAARMSLNGLAANVVSLGSAFDSTSGNLLVLLADQEIVLLDEQGHQGPYLSPRFHGDSPKPFRFLLAVHSIGPGRVLFTNPILQRSWLADLSKSVESASGE